jgi:hypothetical protein
VSNYGIQTSFEEFLPDVLPFVPNAPEFAAINAIRDAAISFCQKTWYWQIDLPAIDLKEGKSVYDIGLCPDQRIVGIVQVYYKDVLLIPKGQDELARLYRDSNWKTLKGEPRYYTQRSRNEITLVPNPTLDDPASVFIRAAVAPTRDSSGIETEIYEIFLEPIAHGARAILYNTPGQPYFDRVSAREADAEFRRGVSEAKIAINKGMTRTSNRVEFQRIL